MDLQREQPCLVVAWKLGGDDIFGQSSEVSEVSQVSQVKGRKKVLLVVMALMSATCQSLCHVTNTPCLNINDANKENSCQCLLFVYRLGIYRVP